LVVLQLQLKVGSWLLLVSPRCLVKAAAKRVTASLHLIFRFRLPNVFGPEGPDPVRWALPLTQILCARSGPQLLETLRPFEWDH